MNEVSAPTTQEASTVISASKAAPNTRDILKAAAEKAINAANEANKASKSDEKEPIHEAVSDDSGAENEAESTENEPEIEAKQAVKKEPTIAERIRLREQAHQMRLQDEHAKRRSAQAVQQHEHEMARMRAEAQADREVAASERARIEKLKTQPFEAIKELGWNTKDLVDGVTRTSDPVYQAEQRILAQSEELKRRLSELDAREKSRAQQEAEYTQRQEQLRAQTTRDNTEKAFIAAATNDEKYSALNTLYTPEDILRKAYAIQTEFHQRTGDVASDDDLAEYMELQAKERLEKIRQRMGGSGNASKVDQAKGPRALSNTVASERRSSPKPANRMSKDERLAQMRHAAEEAMRQRV